MRLPTDWNGRFFYQGNGGVDGYVAPAYGNILGGGPTSNGLLKGFAVISSDAGHPTRSADFGVDPQARLDYGYNAVAELTPMAKRLIKTYYGKRPDTSYIVGTSNGGRHAMVAASRYADQYDGFLAGSPGFNLPQAAVAQLWGVQQYATISGYGDGFCGPIVPLVDWVEFGIKPDAITAKARGAENPEVPPTWHPERTRPLCAYPAVPVCNGSGDVENASSWSCLTP